MRKCHNCQEAPKFVSSDDAEWPVLLRHPNCGFGIDIYHNTEQEAVVSWNEHLEENFPFFYKSKSKKKANGFDASRFHCGRMSAADMLSEEYKVKLREYYVNPTFILVSKEGEPIPFIRWNRDKKLDHILVAVTHNATWAVIRPYVDHLSPDFMHKPCNPALSDEWGHAVNELQKRVVEGGGMSVQDELWWRLGL